MKAGNYVTLRNAKIDMFRGSMRLAVNQWGKIEPAQDVSFDAKASWQPRMRLPPVCRCLTSAARWLALPEGLWAAGQVLDS